MDNVVINTTAATSATAQGLAAYRTQEMDLESLYFLGNSNQTGMTLDGTGNYTGGTFLDNDIRRISDGGERDRAPGSESGDHRLVEREHICAAAHQLPDERRKSRSAGPMGSILQQGDGNTFTGGDVEGCATALHLGPMRRTTRSLGCATRTRPTR